MKQGLRWLLAAIFFVSLTGCFEEEKVDTSWVLGTWELAHNPENDDNDKLVFDSDQSVTVLAEKGGKLQGSYQYASGKLKLSLQAARKTIEVEFEVSSDHSKLIYESGAYYTKK